MELTQAASAAVLAGSNKTGGRHGQDAWGGAAQSNAARNAVSIRDWLGKA
ncbi:hypothetical protein EMIT043CA1_260041 [Pseudomonas brassicacearum]